MLSDFKLLLNQGLFSQNRITLLTFKGFISRMHFINSSGERRKSTFFQKKQTNVETLLFVEKNKQNKNIKPCKAHILKKQMQNRSILAERNCFYPNEDVLADSVCRCPKKLISSYPACVREDVRKRNTTTTM